MRKKHILKRETLVKVANDLHESGKVVGLTHGAFDLFHTSHLDLLQKASEQCDYLVVGVDSDENVAAYKSYKRPIVPEVDRLSIIAELNCVDGVFINSTELTREKYIELYKELGVNVVFIGKGKFAYEDIVADEAREAGAQLESIATKQPSISTSAIINNILMRYASPPESGILYER